MEATYMNHLKNGTIAVGAPGSEMRKLAEIEDAAKDPKPTEKILSSNLLTAKQVVAVYSFAGMTKDTLPKKKHSSYFSPGGQGILSDYQERVQEHLQRTLVSC